jgi:hypothetical protein
LAVTASAETFNKIAMLAMFDSWQDLALGSAIALELVGDDHPRDVGQAFEEFAEKLLRGCLIPSRLDQDIRMVPS